MTDEERKPLEAYIERVGRSRRPFADLYAFLLITPWPLVVLLAAGAFVLLNLSFGALYWVSPGCVAQSDGGFSDSFFFSVQTFGAIGYGAMYAESFWAHVVVTLEAFTSLFFIAALTGVVFSKFSRPHARVLFSKPMLIEKRDGKPTLTFRVANERGNDIVEASIRVAVLRTYRTAEGQEIRRFDDLVLKRDSSPVFMLSWQIFHVVDEQSPIFGLTPAQMGAEDIRFMVALTGLDGTFNQTIHARHLYWGADVRAGHRFVDVIEALPGGVTRMDFGTFHLSVDENADASVPSE